MRGLVHTRSVQYSGDEVSMHGRSRINSSDLRHVFPHARPAQPAHFVLCKTCVKLVQASPEEALGSAVDLILPASLAQLLVLAPLGSEALAGSLASGFHMQADTLCHHHQQDT